MSGVWRDRAELTGAPPLTSWQVPRGARPDAVRDNRLYLIKKAPTLRLTYQIRVLTAMAADGGQRLHIVLPSGATLSRDLRDFVTRHRDVVRVERR